MRLDGVLELLKWATLLDNTEPSAPCVPALKAKVEKLERAVLGSSIDDRGGPLDQSDCMPVPVPARNARRALCGCLVSISLLFGAYEFASAVLRRFE